MLTKKIVILMLLAASLGAGATRWFRDAGPAPDAVPRYDNPREAAAFDAAAPVEMRLAALEQALGIERQARQLLQEELVVLTAEIERLSGDNLGENLRGDDNAVGDPVAMPAAAGASRAPRRRNDPVPRVDRLVEAGFTPAEAQNILRRESELQMEALQARYDARRAGEPTSFDRNSTANALREELGDAAYERYLTASGRPTRVSVSTVMDGSPALAAGMRPGDQIVGYDGQRVFSMNEITRMTMEGDPGQNVLVDIERDGVLMQIAMPRGPLGITGGRRFRR